MFDYHNHLEKYGLTLQVLGCFVRQARRRGVTEMGISEHAYMFSEFRPLYQRQLERSEKGLRRQQREWLLQKAFRWRLDEYVDLIECTRIDGLKLRLGLEVDYFPDSEDELASLLHGWPWDYLIGSVHWIDGWIYDVRQQTWEGRDKAAVWRRYFELLDGAVNSGLFDILGHVDAIKVFGHIPAEPPLDELDQLTASLLQAGMVIEANTAFKYRGLSDDFCPAPYLLKLMKQSGVPITFGSDAHRPQEAGLLLQEAVQQAICCGYRECTGFDRREPFSVELGNL